MPREQSRLFAVGPQDVTRRVLSPKRPSSDREFIVRSCPHDHPELAPGGVAFVHACSRVGERTGTEEPGAPREDPEVGSRGQSQCPGQSRHVDRGADQRVDEGASDREGGPTHGLAGTGPGPPGGPVREADAAPGGLGPRGISRRSPVRLSTVACNRTAHRGFPGRRTSRYDNRRDPAPPRRSSGGIRRPASVQSIDGPPGHRAGHRPGAHAL
jgi:hypothetical protein